MFAKLFGPDDNQVLVKIDSDPERHVPEVRFFIEIPFLGVCSFWIDFENSTEGWDKAKAYFNQIGEAEAIGYRDEAFERFRNGAIGRMNDFYDYPLEGLGG